MNSKKHKLPRRILAMLLAICMFVGLLPVYTPSVQAAPDPSTITGGAGNEMETEATLSQSGVTIVQKGASDTTYNIGEGQVVMIANQNAETPITFTNCTFNLSGATVKIEGEQNGIQYNNGETITKLFISGNVKFENCLFVTEEGAQKSSSAGYDAAIYFFNGDINLTKCTLQAENYKGQFLGLYGANTDNNEAVTFTDSIISTEGNVDGWSYAMYGGSVLKLNHSMMTATGTTVTSGNTNAFYSGDNRTGYDAVYIENGSIVDFSDNQAGGFAINNVNIHVENSSITVNDNAGNACNSGYWIVENSSITMNGNKGGHALSCIGFEMMDSELEILHNGYAGVYIQSRNSSLTNCTVDIRCNGEKMLSFSAGDTWVGVTPNKFNLQIDDCTSNAQPESAWLGAVGRMGSVTTTEGSSVVAYDLNSNAEDNLKSNTEPVLKEASIALNDETHQHTLLLNPRMTSNYARGNAENSAGNNDADLFKDDAYYYDEENEKLIDKAIAEETAKKAILDAEKAKIGTLTDAQLSHHKYDWNVGEVKYEATPELYGAMAYPCTDACRDYLNHSESHSYSFDCQETYVYAPLVGLGFDDNVDDGSVTNMPDNQTEIAYNGTAVQPTVNPTRSSSDGGSWMFTGWFKDKECTEPFGFSNTTLTDNWTTVYAGWEKTEGTVTITPADLTIYIAGEEGYEAVVGGEEDPVEQTQNALPKPIFKLNADTDNIKDGMVFTSSEGKSWIATHIEKVDGAESDEEYYSLEPAVAGQDEVRVTYTDSEGVSHISSEFDITKVDELYTEYDIQLYTNTVDINNVVARDSDDKLYSVMLGEPGTLTIRTVENTESDKTITPVTTQSPDSRMPEGTGKIVVDEDTTYTVNDLGIPMPEGQDPSLLFDTIVTSDGEDRESALENKVAERVNTPNNRTRRYQSQYLDLVDADNGNIWLTASKPVTVYWAYPDGTDASDDFTLWHFEGLHRDNSDGGQSGFEIGDLEQATVENVRIDKGQYGISFTVEPGGFSPFVLTWTEGSGQPIDPGTDPDDPDTPALDKVNHFLYIEGYPEDYRTGEYSDNEDLWPVKPQGNITRAEVATIFYRLLKDEVREEIETDVNSFPDVNADDWFNVTVSSLANMGAISGYEDGTFRPNEPITRAELASMAVRFYDAFEAEYEEGTFLDVDGDEWYADAIAAAEELGILGGYPDGTVRPNNNITRAETCAIVNRVLERRPHDEHLGDVDEMRTWPDNLPGAWYYADMQEATNGHYYEWIDIDGVDFEEWTEVDKDYDWTKR